jgi:hypothetical protein
LDAPETANDPDGFYAASGAWIFRRDGRTRDFGDQKVDQLSAEVVQA